MWRGQRVWQEIVELPPTQTLSAEGMASGKGRIVSFEGNNNHKVDPLGLRFSANDTVCPFATPYPTS